MDCKLSFECGVMLINRMRGIESNGKSSRILGRSGVDLSGKRVTWIMFPINDVSSLVLEGLQGRS